MKSVEPDVLCMLYFQFAIRNFCDIVLYLKTLLKPAEVAYISHGFTYYCRTPKNIIGDWNEE